MTELRLLKELPHSLRASVLDAIFFMLMMGLGESYLGAFAEFLGLSSFVLGLVVSFPLLIGSTFQLLGVRFLDKRWSRRRLIVCCASMQGLFWIAIAMMPWIIQDANMRGFALLALISLAAVFSQMAMPAWTSLIGDLVPDTTRGSFFGLRNKICGYFLIASFLSAGALLTAGKTHNLTLELFSLLFILAGIARLGSAFYLSQHEDPEYDVSTDDRFSFFDFITRAKHSNFARFSIFHALFNFTIFFVGPYFTLYLLRELQFSYFEFTLIAVAGIGANFLFMHAWGKFSDRFGNKDVINICTCGLILVPVSWTFSSNIFYLIMLQIFAGAMTAGFQLAASNFLFDSVKPGKRGRCMAYLSLINSSCIVMGSIFGGLLLDGVTSLATPQIGNSYIALFVTGSLIRMAIVLFGLKFFHEVREADRLNYRQPLYRIARVTPLSYARVGVAVGTFRNNRKRMERTASRKELRKRIRESQKRSANA